MYEELHKHIGELKETSFGEFSVILPMVSATFKSLLPKGTKTSNAADPPLERAIERILKRAGFLKIRKKDLLSKIKYKPKQFQEILEKDYPLPYYRTDKWFVHQPCGMQASPDFLIAMGNHYLCIDLKSNKTNPVIMWNSGEICSTYFYIGIFPQGTYYFIGKDYPIASSEIIAQVRLNMKKTDNINNKLLSNDPNNRAGLKVTGRPAWHTDPLNINPPVTEWLVIMEKAERFIRERVKIK